MTDEGYYIGTADNPNMTLQDEVDLLKADGINVSVVTEQNLKTTYQPLYGQTGGIWADINKNFADAIMPLANQMAVVSNKGAWIRLSNGSIVHLDKDPSLEDMSIDTDGDGVPDLIELGEEKQISWFDNNEHTMKTYSYWTFMSNPTVKDTDGDKIDDDKDSNPNKYDIAIIELNESHVVLNTSRGVVFLDVDIDEYYKREQTSLMSKIIGDLEAYRIILEHNKRHDLTMEELEILAMLDLNTIRGYLVKESQETIDQLYTRLEEKPVENTTLKYISRLKGSNFKIEKHLSVKTSSLMLLPRLCISEKITKAELDSHWSKYQQDMGEQMLLSNWSGKVTLGGTVGQIFMGFCGLDVHTDIGDLVHNLTHWKNNWGHIAETSLNAISLWPVVGMIKYGDEFGVIFKNADGVLEARKLSKFERIKGLKRIKLLDEMKATAKSLVKGSSKLTKNTYEQFLLSLKKTFNLYNLEDFLAFEAAYIVDELVQYGDEVDDLAKYYPIEFQESVSKIARRVNKAEDIGHVKKIVAEEFEHLRKGTGNLVDAINDSQKWLDLLSADELSSLRKYQTGTYENINKSLRSGMELTAEQLGELKNIDSAIAKGVLGQDKILFRGFTQPDIISNWDALVNGGTMKFTDDAFVSTSKMQSTALEFAQKNGDDAIVATLKVKEGTNIANIDALNTMFFEEAEILLGRGHTYTITQAWVEDGIKRVILEVN